MLCYNISVESLLWLPPSWYIPSQLHGSGRFDPCSILGSGVGSPSIRVCSWGVAFHIFLSPLHNIPRTALCSCVLLLCCSIQLVGIKRRVNIHCSFFVDFSYRLRTTWASSKQLENTHSRILTYRGSVHCCKHLNNVRACMLPQMGHLCSVL